MRGEPQTTRIPQIIAGKKVGVNSVLNSTQERCNAGLGARFVILLEFLASRLLDCFRPCLMAQGQGALLFQSAKSAESAVSISESRSVHERLGLRRSSKLYTIISWS